MLGPLNATLPVASSLPVAQVTPTRLLSAFQEHKAKPGLPRHTPPPLQESFGEPAAQAGRLDVTPGSFLRRRPRPTAGSGAVCRAHGAPVQLQSRRPGPSGRLLRTATPAAQNARRGALAHLRPCRVSSPSVVRALPLRGPAPRPGPGPRRAGRGCPRRGRRSLRRLRGGRAPGPRLPTPCASSCAARGG